MLGVTVGIIILIELLLVRHPRSSSGRVACLVNLKALAVGLSLYAEEYGDKYPPTEHWCDLLATKWASKESFCCPKGKKHRCSYAMNPNAAPRSDPDTVLLFECQSGWNQVGGPELLTTEHHKGCCVLFVDGTVMFIKAEEVVGLHWADEKTLPADVRNARRPRDDGELKYWLENMTGYHRFTIDEIRAATGMTADGDLHRLRRVWCQARQNRPVQAADSSLLVLPYPGGRHPRIGFLEGAVDPQREPSSAYSRRGTTTATSSSMCRRRSGRTWG